MSKRREKEPEEETTEKIAEMILYEWWYSIAKEIFEKVCVIAELDEEQKDALREVALRPNDFQIEIEEKD
jgi:hypothetical protein